MAPKVLIVLTSFDKIPATGNPTGWYLHELAHPYEVLENKAELVLASPKGGNAPLDPNSVKAAQDANDKGLISFSERTSIWANTKPLKEFLGRASEFDALFYPGGHGPVFDLVKDPDSIQLIQEFWEAGKVVSAVCHGPIVFANAVTGGQPLVKGKRVTGFTNQEEDIAQMTQYMPLLLETVLQEKGASFEKAAEPFGAKVIADGKLITGQNPASAQGVGEEIAKALGI